jgi:hypothetical protein
MPAAGPLATLYRYFRAAPPLTQIPRLDVLYGRRNLDDSAAAPRIVLAWSEEDDRYTNEKGQGVPDEGDGAGTLLAMRVCPVEVHLWAAALTADGTINASAEEEDHFTALEVMQQVVIQAFKSPDLWTRYRATPLRLRKKGAAGSNGQNSVLGMRGILTMEVRLPVQDRPDLLVTPTTTTTASATINTD